MNDAYVETRNALQRVAVHVMARARSEATGRFGLRVTPGGFGTPEFGDGPRRIRVSGGVLVAESGTAGAASTETLDLVGATLADAAALAGVDLDTELSVGRDTPPLGDPHRPLRLDRDHAAVVDEWFGIVAQALDRVVAGAPVSAEPSMAQLWPEHFDVALDIAAAPDRRVNLGGAAGDGFEPGPYAYVGPWTDDRPGDARFWNVSFGAVLHYTDVVAADDPVDRLVEFYERGLRHLA